MLRLRVLVALLIVCFIAVAGCSKPEPLYGPTRSLAAAYVLHPNLVADTGAKEEFTSLQLVVLVKMYLDFGSVQSYSKEALINDYRRFAEVMLTASQGKKPQAEKTFISEARSAAVYILDSKDPIGEANRILRLEVPDGLVERLRPHAGDSLNVDATISALDRSLNQAISLSGGKAENTELCKELYEGSRRMTGFINDVDKKVGLKSDNSTEKFLDGFSSVFETAATGTMDLVVSIGAHTYKTFTALSVRKRVKEVWNYWQDVIDFSGNLGAQLGHSLSRSARQLGRINLENSWIRDEFQDSYSSYINGGSPNVSEWSTSSWGTPSPVVIRDTNAVYAPVPGCNMTDVYDSSFDHGFDDAWDDGWDLGVYDGEQAWEADLYEAYMRENTREESYTETESYSGTGNGTGGTGHTGGYENNFNYQPMSPQERIEIYREDHYGTYTKSFAEDRFRGWNDGYEDGYWDGYYWDFFKVLYYYDYTYLFDNYGYQPYDTGYVDGYFYGYLDGGGYPLDYTLGEFGYDDGYFAAYDEAYDAGFEYGYWNGKQHKGNAAPKFMQKLKENAYIPPCRLQTLVDSVCLDRR